MDEIPCSRRGVLARASVLIAAGSAGCVREVGEQFPSNEKWPTSGYTPDLPVTEQSDVLESGIEVFEGREILDESGFEDALSDRAVALEAVEREQGVLTVEYVFTERVERGTLHGIALIAGAYAALIEGGYDAAFLEVTVLDDESSSVGAAEIETPWASKYNTGEYTATEYGELVASTVESRRYPADVSATPEG